jgi:hypothetical protein
MSAVPGKLASHLNPVLGRLKMAPLWNLEAVVI